MIAVRPDLRIADQLHQLVVVVIRFGPECRHIAIDPSE